MCGVIGCFSNRELSLKELEFARALLRESRVRGIHAFGAAVSEDNSNFTIKRSFSIKEIDGFISYGNPEKIKTIVAHTRYDTSGDWHILENNQPVVNGKDFLVFNGVVRQSAKHEFEKEFGVKCETENDGEIVIHLMRESLLDPQFQRAAHLLFHDPKVSYAGIEYINGQMTISRNKNRPLYISIADGALFVTSTKDILERANAEIGIEFDSVTLIEPERFYLPWSMI